MRLVRWVGVCLIGMLLNSSGLNWAQPFGADDPMRVLARDAGNWKCRVLIWMDPQGEPEVTHGEETNRLLGNHWLVSDFRMQFMGMDFEGHGTFGYDDEKKKYVGTWIDSMSPYATWMEGTWDESAQTMTMLGAGKGEDGQPQRTKSVVKYLADGTHVFTMYHEVNGEFIRSMEITYTRK